MVPVKDLPLVSKIGVYLEFVKFQHSVFALPFAMISFLLACGRSIPWSILGWVLVAVVSARSTAMGFNRVVDRHYDALNPRTCDRALPAGVLKISEAWAFVLLSAGLFLFSASRINSLAFALSPLALAILWGYSFTKRFTVWSHLILGFCLGMAPAGVWIAVRGTLELPALLLTGAVTLWTAGFDLLYACQDVEFDRRLGLFSVPARFGIPFALKLSTILHLGMILALVLLWRVAHLGLFYFVGLALVTFLLIWQHRLVKPNDLSRVNAAFFTANGFLSVGLFLVVLLDRLLFSSP